MSEKNLVRSVQARSIRGAVIMTGDGNSLHADLEALHAALAPLAPAAAPPPADDAEGIAKHLAEALETAKQAEDFTTHAAVIAERVGAVCRWLGGHGAALLALVGRSGS